MLNRDETMARQQVGEVTMTNGVPSPTPSNGWRYFCPVQGHSTICFGAATAAARPRSSLQTGRVLREKWITLIRHLGH